MPGPLVVFGNPRRRVRRNSEERKEPPISESAAWLLVIETAKQHHLTELENIGRLMYGQVRGHIHTNPASIRHRIQLAKHVQAIAYVHADDGEEYVHGFGDAVLNERELDRGILNLNDLKDRTNVAMFAEPDGSVRLIGTKGQPLAALFD